MDRDLAALLSAWCETGTPGGATERLAGRLSSAVRARCWREIAAVRRQGLLLPVTPRFSAPDPLATAPSYAHGLQHLTLSVSEECNLRCRYCLYGSNRTWVRPHRDRFMSRRTATRAVASFLARATDVAMPVISFYGGEPLLNRPVIEAVCAQVAAHPRRDAIRLVLDTNGLRLRGVADLVHRHGLFLQVSMDGPAASHDRYRVSRAGRPTHRRLENILTRLLADAPHLANRLRIQVTLMPDADLEAIDDYFAEFPPFRRNGLSGVPQLGVNDADLAGLPRLTLLLTDEVLDHRRRQLVRLRQRFVTACRQGRREELGPLVRALFEPRLIRWHHRQRGLPAGPRTPAGCCQPGVRRLHVRSDGRLQPCERVGRTMILGDVEGWLDADRIQTLWEGFLAAVGDRCRTCWAWRECDLCFTALAASWEQQEIPPLPASLCDGVRRRLEQTMLLYADVRGQDGRGTAWLERTSVA